MSHELLVFGFHAAPWRFEGRLLGALERADGGGALRAVEVLLVVARDVRTAEVSAIVLRGVGDGRVPALVDFRLDENRRREATREALEDDRTGALERLGGALVSGRAIVAMLVQREWAEALIQAVERSGGRKLVDMPTAATDTTVIATLALAAVQAGETTASH